MSKIDFFLEHLEIRQDPLEILADAVAGWKMLPWPFNTQTRDPNFPMWEACPKLNMYIIHKKLGDVSK